MEEGYKEVDFKKYCETCKFKKNKETETPCDECLSNPVNLHSHKPVKYTKNETGTTKKNGE